MLGQSVGKRAGGMIQVIAVARAIGGQTAALRPWLLELQVTWDHLPLACLIVRCLSAATGFLSHRPSLQPGKVPNLLHMTEMEPESIMCVQL